MDFNKHEPNYLSSDVHFKKRKWVLINTNISDILYTLQKGEVMLMITWKYITYTLKKKIFKEIFSLSCSI
jgi:hypothetical protein